MPEQEYSPPQKKQNLVVVMLVIILNIISYPIEKLFNLLFQNDIDNYTF